MAQKTYCVDFKLELWATHMISADSAEEAERIGNELIRSDSFWEHLLDTYNDPEKTDWLPENASAEVWDAPYDWPDGDKDPRYLTQEQINEYLEG